MLIFYINNVDKPENRVQIKMKAFIKNDHFRILMLHF